MARHAVTVRAGRLAGRCRCGGRSSGACAMAPAPTVASRPARTRLFREAVRLNANFMGNFLSKRRCLKSIVVTYGFWLQVESKCGGRLFPSRCPKVKIHPYRHSLRVVPFPLAGDERHSLAKPLLGLTACSPLSPCRGRCCSLAKPVPRLLLGKAVTCAVQQGFEQVSLPICPPLSMISMPSSEASSLCRRHRATPGASCAAYDRPQALSACTAWLEVSPPAMPRRRRGTALSTRASSSPEACASARLSTALPGHGLVRGAGQHVAALGQQRGDLC
jgi:hypothetical protein